MYGRLKSTCDCHHFLECGTGTTLLVFITVYHNITKNCPQEMTRFYGHDALDVILAGMQHQIPPGELTALPQTPKLTEARKQKQKQCSCTVHCLSQSDTNAMQRCNQLSELGAINKC